MIPILFLFACVLTAISIYNSEKNSLNNCNIYDAKYPNVVKKLLDEIVEELEKMQIFYDPDEMLELYELTYSQLKDVYNQLKFINNEKPTV